MPAPARLFTVLAVASLVALPMAASAQEAGGWWHYESTGPMPFLGAQEGEAVSVRETAAGTVEYSVHQRTQGREAVIETWENRTYRFDETGSLLELVEASTVREEGKPALVERRTTSFDPAIPLTGQAAWNATVNETLEVVREDDRGPYDNETHRGQVEHRLSSSGNNTTWERGDHTRIYRWGAGWVTQEQAGDAGVRLVSASSNEGDLDQDGTPDEQDEDADGDGYSHEEETANGTDPQDATSRPPPEAQPRPDPGSSGDTTGASEDNGQTTPGDTDGSPADGDGTPSNDPGQDDQPDADGSGDQGDSADQAPAAGWLVTAVLLGALAARRRG